MILRTISAILLSVFSTKALSAGSSGASSLGSGISFAGSKRMALSYSQTTVSSLSASNIDPGFERTYGGTYSYEIGMPLSLVFSGNYFQNKNVLVNWKGTPNTPVEFYGYLINLGVKFTLPFAYVQPFVGGGYGFGVFTMSNPQDRETNSYLIGVYSRGSRGAQSAYGQIGLDLRLGTSGIRIEYIGLQPDTDSCSEIGDQSYKMKMSILNIGMFADF